jgi:hypothetical protein
MRNSIWTPVALAMLATTATAVAGLDPLPEQTVLDDVRIIQDSLSRAPKVSTPEEIYKGLATAPTTIIKSIIEELQRMTYTELFTIKLSDNEACALVSCRGVNAGTVKQLADAVLLARDKEQSMRAASINSTISISGGILAVLSFVMSASSTIASIRSKKAS